MSKVIECNAIETIELYVETCDGNILCYLGKGQHYAKVFFAVPAFGVTCDIGETDVDAVVDCIFEAFENSKETNYISYSSETIAVLAREIANAIDSYIKKLMK